MSRLRGFPAVAVLLGSAACFTPSPSDPPASTDGASTGADADEADAGPTDGDGMGTSDGVEATGGSEGDGGPTTDGTGGPGCPPGVFGRSMFDQACFQ